MKLTSYIQIIFAVFYLLGREGFVSMPDVFNKTRPNRHINTAQLPQTVMSFIAYSIVADKQNPHRLPFKVQQQNTSLANNSHQNFYSFPLTAKAPYKGIRIMPPPLLG